MLFCFPYYVVPCLTVVRTTLLSNWESTFCVTCKLERKIIAQQQQQQQQRQRDLKFLFYFFLFYFLLTSVRHCGRRTSMQQFSTFNTNFVQRPGALSNTVPSQFKLTIDDHSRLINFSEFH